MTDLALLGRIAREHALDADLVRALVSQESGNNPFAFRPEPRYRYFADCRTGDPFRRVSPDEIASKVAPADFPYLAGGRDQEWWGQQASWGLTQIMGAVAREQGFRGPYLTQLCDEATNLTLGCRVLASAMKWANGDVTKALASYNAGRGGHGSALGLSYARKVLAKLAQIRGEA